MPLSITKPNGAVISVPMQFEGQSIRAGVGADFLEGSLGEGPPAPGFNPANLFASGEEGIWLEVDPTTTFTDTARTTSATVGDAVAGWADKSGNGYHASQPTLASRPILRQDAGGAYYLEFDGSNDFITSGSIDFATGLDQQITAASAFDATGQTGTGVIYEAGRAGINRSGSCLYMRDDGSGYEGRWWNNVETQGVRKQYATTPGHDVFTVLMDRDQAAIADAMKLRVDGVEVATTTLPSDIATTQSFRNYPLSIGRYYNISAGYLDGKLYGLIVVNRTLTAEELTGLDAYLAAKSGVTL